MVENTALAAVTFMKDRLLETGLKLDRVILFRSQARGAAAAESDIDVIIISEDFNDKDIFKRVRITKEAEIMTIRKFMIPLDIMTLTPDEFDDDDSLLAAYAKGGKVIYRA